MDEREEMYILLQPIIASPWTGRKMKSFICSQSPEAYPLRTKNGFIRLSQPREATGLTMPEHLLREGKVLRWTLSASFASIH